MKSSLRSISMLIMLVTTFSLTRSAHAKPWVGYGRTVPVHNYLSDIGSDLNHHFGVNGAYMGYTEPELSEAELIPNPLTDSRYDSYNVIVVINDNENEPYPELFGKAQTMRVYSRGDVQKNNGLLYYWSISTGIKGARTDKGYFRPQSFSSRHWSKKFNAPMLWAVFFDGGKAMHSATWNQSIEKLGKVRASHGCVRIEDHRAEELFHLIGQSGYGSVSPINPSGTMSSTKVNSYKTLIIVH